MVHYFFKCTTKCIHASADRGIEKQMRGIAFKPKLPAWKEIAIQRVACNAQDRIIAVFDRVGWCGV